MEVSKPELGLTLGFLTGRQQSRILVEDLVGPCVFLPIPISPIFWSNHLVSCFLSEVKSPPFFDPHALETP